MSIEVASLLLFGSMVLLLILGLPLSLRWGGLATLATIFLWGPEALPMIASRAFGNASSSLWSRALVRLYGNHVAARRNCRGFYDAMHHLIGSLRGGLAIGTVIICTLFAAMSGISAVGTVTMGLIAPPAMLKRNYNKSISLGCIAAGGFRTTLSLPVYCL
jgi:TRAP-type mannitol/chloroaromatic compound transport system permease large subunit